MSLSIYLVTIIICTCSKPQLVLNNNQVKYTEVCTKK